MSQHPLTHEDRVGILRSYSGNARVFIETGTAEGETTRALRDDFDDLYTIELDYPNYLNACLKLMDCRNVTCIHGDSDIVLPRLLDTIGAHPAVFWLDAHYNGETKGPVEVPMILELEHIFYREVEGHVIVIDDIHLCGVDPSYPTLPELQRACGDRPFKVIDGAVLVVECVSR